MKRALFSACIVMVCSAVAWGAAGFPASLDKATTDEPIVKVIKIGDKAKAPASKCGKSCGKRPCSKPRLGSDIFVVKSDACGGCDKKGSKDCAQSCGKGKTARCPVTGACSVKKLSKGEVARCPVTGARAPKKLGKGKAACCPVTGACVVKKGDCCGKCDGKCGSKCATKCGKGKTACCPVTGACVAKKGDCCGKCGAKCATKCGKGKAACFPSKKGHGKRGKKPHKIVQEEEIVIHLSDIPGHEGLGLLEDAEVHVMVHGDDEYAVKFFGDHGKSKCTKKAYHAKKKRSKADCHKGSCHGKSHAHKHKGCDCDCGGSCCGDKSHGCKDRCKTGCKGDCDCCGDGACCSQFGGDVRGMIVIMINHDGSYSIKTVGDCSMGGGCCPALKGLHHGFGHHGKKAHGCHCDGHGHHGKKAHGGDCCGDCTPRKGHGAKSRHWHGHDATKHGKKAKDCHKKWHGKKGKGKSSRRTSSCGGI